MPLRGTAGDLSRDSDGGFSNKTMEREWNTSEEQLRKGKSFRVRYVGRVAIVISMRTLEFSDRALVAKECIARVCEATGITASSRKRKTEKRIQQVLGTVDLTNANSDVDLLVSVDSLKIIALDGEMIASHEIPEISFASGGDAETMDFMAYVGKNNEQSGGGEAGGSSRWCYVIECGTAATADCVATIGQAFDLRFKEHLKTNADQPQQHARPNSEVRPSTSAAAKLPNIVPTSSPAAEKRKPPARLPQEAEYYNDMPGKAAPDTEMAHMANSEENVKPPKETQRTRTEVKALQLSNSTNTLPSSSSRPDANLIDLNSPAYDKPKKNEDFSEFLETQKELSQPSHRPAENQDPFDVRNVDHLMYPDLESFAWFHGKMSRKEAEALLRNDGDFLVRASASAAMDSPAVPLQQFVLSGFHLGTRTHILLVDYDGIVRTKNQEFLSVPHLIDVHLSSREPLLSGDREIFLLKPIPSIR